MGYWMRFFDTKKKPLTLNAPRLGLQRIDRKFGTSLGQLTYDGAAFAQIDISVPGDGTFDNELAEFRTNVAAKSGKKSAAAKARLMHGPSRA